MNSYTCARIAHGGLFVFCGVSDCRFCSDIFVENIIPLTHPPVINQKSYFDKRLEKFGFVEARNTMVQLKTIKNDFCSFE